jgi:hypothetical protein
MDGAILIAASAVRVVIADEAPKIEDFGGLD